MKTQKILHCVSSFQVGGAEKCAVNLLTYQHEQGYKVAALSYGHVNDPFQAIVEKRGIRVINNTQSVLKRLATAKRLIRDFDIIHIHSPAVIRALMPIFPFLLDKKVIYTHHGEDSPSQRGMRLSHWIAALYIDQDFAVSEKVKTSVKVRYNWSPENTVVIQNGVIANSALPKPPSRPFRFGCVARMVPLKQIDKVVHAFAELNGEYACELHLFGDGPERENVERAIAQHQLHDQVFTHGNVLDEDDIYKHLDCLVINSTTEGLPMALIEALARGIPAISTRVGEIPNLDQQQHFCLFVDDTQASLTAAMNEMATNEMQWQELSASGLALVKSSFDISQVSDIYLKAVNAL